MSKAQRNPLSIALQEAEKSWGMDSMGMAGNGLVRHFRPRIRGTSAWHGALDDEPFLHSIARNFKSMTSHTILLVEDNADDVFFMERAVRKSGISAPMHVVRDGQQAIDYLSGIGSYADREQHPLPTLVFLDLKLPYIHGFDVLEWIRAESTFKNLPVAVLTSSAEERDRSRAEQLNAQAYLVKPADAPMLLQVMGSIAPDSPSTK